MTPVRLPGKRTKLQLTVTGYRAVSNQEEQDNPPPNKPHCPAFAEIGNRLGSFSLGLIPIGAYEPAFFLSPVHCTPKEAVHIFQETVSGIPHQINR